jgi:hypothetical protein
MSHKLVINEEKIESGNRHCFFKIAELVRRGIDVMPVTYGQNSFYKTLKEDKTFLEIHDEQYDFWRLIVEGCFKDELYTERARF